MYEIWYIYYPWDHQHIQGNEHPLRIFLFSFVVVLFHSVSSGFLSLWISLYLVKFNINGIIWYILFLGETWGSSYFNSAQFGDSSMFFIEIVYSFLLLSTIPLFHIFIYPYVDGPLDYFQVLPIANKTMNICVQVFIWSCVFISLG